MREELTVDRQRWRTHLETFRQRKLAQTDSGVKAAVLLPLLMREGRPHVLFTRRTEHLRHHAGQISFPGGRFEPDDDNVVRTALRETQEEIGVAPEQIEVLGTLPDYVVSTGFVITPVVGVFTTLQDYRLDAFEVAGVFDVPLEHLLDPVRYQRHRICVGGSARQAYAISYKGHFIWGATAGILADLMEFFDFLHRQHTL